MKRKKEARTEPMQRTIGVATSEGKSDAGKGGPPVAYWWVDDGQRGFSGGLNTQLQGDYRRLRLEWLRSGVHGGSNRTELHPVLVWIGCIFKGLPGGSAMCIYAPIGGDIPY